MLNEQGHYSKSMTYCIKSSNNYWLCWFV